MRKRSMVFVGWLALGPMASLNCWGEIPSGPGKDETIKACATCHSIEQAVSARQGKQEWAETMSQMAGMGAKIPDASFNVILDYLAKNFSPDAPAPIRVNTASAVELESLLLLKRSESAALIRYRQENGKFKAIEDLKKVPGLTYSKIEAKRDLLVF